MIPSIYVPQYKSTVIRTVRWWLDYMRNEHKARRIQTWGDQGVERAKWLGSLGFEVEGVLNSYMPDGKPVTIWGLVKCRP